MKVKYLSIEEILWIHYKVVSDFGGLHGVRDEKRLKSVVESVAMITFGQEQYKTIFDKAAVYFCNIIADHAFVDGNKRTAVTVASIFLMKNGYSLNVHPKGLEDFAVKVAVDRLTIEQISAWLKIHSK